MEISSSAAMLPGMSRRRGGIVKRVENQARSFRGDCGRCGSLIFLGDGLDLDAADGTGRARARGGFDFP